MSVCSYEASSQMFTDLGAFVQSGNATAFQKNLDDSVVLDLGKGGGAQGRARVIAAFRDAMSRYEKPLLISLSENENGRVYEALIMSGKTVLHFELHGRKGCKIDKIQLVG